MMDSKIKSITAKFFQEIIVGDQKSCILLFSAKWSGHAVMMDNMMGRVSQELDSGIQFFKIDVDIEVDISTFFGITNVPTTIMLKDGEVVEYIRGIIPAKKFRSKIVKIYFSE